MKDVIRITIKGSSGYGPYYEAYEDKVVISSDTIRYEFIPKVQTSNHTVSKWSYKTTSPKYDHLFRKTVTAVEEILNRDEYIFATDVGMTSFMIQYSDKTKQKREFFSPSDEFKDCFAIIKQMIPGCEEIPAVLRTFDDQ